MKTQPLKTWVGLLTFCCISAATAADKAPALPDLRDFDQAGARQKSLQALDAAGAASRGAGRVFPDIKVPRSGVDIGQIAARFQAAPVKPEEESLLIFVTLAMPERALQNLARQAKAAGGVLVLRGLPGGLSNWAKSMQALKPLADTGASIIVHPQLFSAWQIVQAPTFVLASDAQAEACVSEQKKACGQSLRASGDVSLAYVLERWSNGKGALADEARQRLARLEGRP